MSASVGGEYDTNVSVDEVDLSSGKSDYAAVIDFDLDVEVALTDRTDVSLNYRASQSTFQEFKGVNRLTQIAGADLSHNLDGSSISLSAYYIDSRLDNKSFLTYSRISPSLSGFLSKRWFSRGAYVYSERKVDQRALRNVNSHTGEIDFYYFHRGLRSYGNVGYRYRNEDAIAPELDFKAHLLKIRYIRRLNLNEQRVKIEAAIRYELRQYQSPSSAVFEARRDDRLRFQVDMEVPLSNQLTWQWYFSHGDYVSNLPRADFTQTILGTKLKYTW
ncbi:surface lipoprotein assembly modifier [Congregibacter sp.]|uniref:surface lipoprotein assembly modifier n=1 Tax=Congregibacter sp. TaxID=2744308 RepID=UPI003F6D9D7B